MTQRLTVLLAQWGTEVIPVALSSSLNAVQRLPRLPRHYAVSAWLRPCSLPCPVSLTHAWQASKKTELLSFTEELLYYFHWKPLACDNNSKNNENHFLCLCKGVGLAFTSSLTLMSNCLSSVCGKLGPSRVQSVVSSQGSLDSDMQGKCSSKRYSNISVQTG